MKRAQAHEIGPAFFKLNMPPDHLDHVGAPDKFLNEGLRNGHDPIVPFRVLAATSGPCNRAGLGYC